MEPLDLPVAGHRRSWFRPFRGRAPAAFIKRRLCQDQFAQIDELMIGVRPPAQRRNGKRDRASTERIGEQARGERFAQGAGIVAAPFGERTQHVRRARSTRGRM